MNHVLKALCMEILNGDVDGDRFATLLLEAGIQLDDTEWRLANRLIEKGERINTLMTRLGHIIH